MRIGRGRAAVIPSRLCGKSPRQSSPLLAAGEWEGCLGRESQKTCSFALSRSFVGKESEQKVFASLKAFFPYEGRKAFFCAVVTVDPGLSYRAIEEKQ